MPRAVLHPAPRRRRPRRAILLVALLALSGGLLSHFLSQRIVLPTLAPVVRRYTPQQAGVAVRRLEAVRAQLAESAPKPHPVTVRISESDINTYLATDPHLRHELTRQGVEAAQIILSPPATATLRASVLFNRQPLNIQLVGQLVPDAKTGLRYRVTSAQVDRLMLPPAQAEKEADKLLHRVLAPLKKRMPFAVQKVEVIDGELVLTVP